MEQANGIINRGSQEVRAPEPATPSATVNESTAIQNDAQAQSIASIQVPSQDRVHAQTDDQVETLPSARTALLDYDLRDWETATYFATRTKFGQHVIGWMFEQVLEKMPSGVVSCSILTCCAMLTHLDPVWMEVGWQPRFYRVHCPTCSESTGRPE